MVVCLFVFYIKVILDMLYKLLWFFSMLCWVLLISDQPVRLVLNIYLLCVLMVGWGVAAVFSRLHQKMLSDSEAAELLSFLTPGTRPDVKGQATEYILGLSGHRQDDEEEEEDAINYAGYDQH